jgi:hypothetical protein
MTCKNYFPNSVGSSLHVRQLHNLRLWSVFYLKNIADHLLSARSSHDRSPIIRSPTRSTEWRYFSRSLFATYLQVSAVFDFKFLTIVMCPLLLWQDGHTLLHLLVLARMKTKIPVPTSPLICFILFSYV